VSGPGLGAGFNRLWLASSLSDFGTYVTMLALPLTGILVLGLRPLQVSGLLVAEVGAGMLAGVVAGAVTDRIGLRRAMVLSDAVRFAALAAVPVASRSGALSYPLLLGAAAVVGAFSSLFFAAQSRRAAGAGRSRGSRRGEQPPAGDLLCR
jgi:MFS family permease